MWTYIILAEMFNAQNGLGYLINVAGRLQRSDQVYALIILIALLVVTLEWSAHCVLGRAAPGCVVAQDGAHAQEHQAGEIRLLAADAVPQPAKTHRSHCHAHQAGRVDGPEVRATQAPVLDQEIADMPHQEQVVT